MNPKHFKTGELKTKLFENGLAQTSVYLVNVTSGNPNFLSFLGNRGNVNTERINLLCADAVLPGTSLATHEVTNDYSGVTEKIAYRRIYDDSLDLTFYVDGKYELLTYFDAWMDYITGQGSTSDTNNYEKNNAYYRMNYPATYKSNIELIKFEKDNSKSQQPAIEYKFIDAFPTNIVSMPISYNSSELLKCTVSFSYIRYVRKTKQYDNLSYVPPTDPQSQARSNSPSNPEFRGTPESTGGTSSQRSGFSSQLPDPLINRGQSIA